MTPEHGSLASLLTPGMRIAVADGCGAPRSVSAELSDVARNIPGLRLVLGWVPVADEPLDFGAFDDVVVLMGGWGMQVPIHEGQARLVPVRWSTVPALLAGPLRPDVLVASVVPHPDGGVTFGAEVSWMTAAVEAGARVAAVLSHRHPRGGDSAPLPSDQVVIVGESDNPPIGLVFTAPEQVHRDVAAHVGGLLLPGSRLQIGPGALGTAVLEAVDVPVHVDSGLLPDGVVGLERRGLLLSRPVGTYLAGGPELFSWAHARGVLHRMEYTHDTTRLSSGAPFFAVNTALEIDEQGSVNIESVRGRTIASPGGHPDYAVAGARSAKGLSIIAMPSHHQGRSALVHELSGPVATGGHDVDVVVTEHGVVDLRGLDRSERRLAMLAHWDPLTIETRSGGTVRRESVLE